MKTYLDLIDLIEQQNLVIKQQSETIAKLLNQNAEQENLINVMMQEHTDWNDEKLDEAKDIAVDNREKSGTPAGDF